MFDDLSRERERVLLLDRDCLLVRERVLLRDLRRLRERCLDLLVYKGCCDVRLPLCRW